MPRVQPQNLDDEERKRLLDLLWTSVAELETRDEVRAFFKDLLSETEAIMLARRIRIAQLILQGKTYEEIRMLMKTASATIASVHQWLASGFKGYALTIKRLELALDKRRRRQEKKQQELQPYSFGWLKKRYPLHFLLMNLPELTLGVSA